MSIVQKITASLRQRALPPEVRLPKAEFDGDQLDLLEELIQMIQPTLVQADAASRNERRSMARFLADLGTGVWRIRRKIAALPRVPKELQDALFSLESTWNSMMESGVELVDHLGELPSGAVPRVVEVRLVPGLDREQIVETIRPTIRLKSEVVQGGEVVLGRPAPPGWRPPLEGQEASGGEPAVPAPEAPSPASGAAEGEGGEG